MIGLWVSRSRVLSTSVRSIPCRGFSQFFRVVVTLIDCWKRLVSIMMLQHNFRQCCFWSWKARKLNNPPFNPLSIESISWLHLPLTVYRFTKFLSQTTRTDTPKAWLGAHIAFLTFWIHSATLRQCVFNPSLFICFPGNKFPLHFTLGVHCSLFQSFHYYLNFVSFCYYSLGS